MITQRPMLFSTDMVQAIRNLYKTKTRRVIKQEWLRCLTVEDDYDKLISLCPYGKIGDQLWVRETFAFQTYFNGLREEHHAIYKADYLPTPVAWNWKPSIFMPKAASRIWLEITNVKIERLQDITEDDATAEGVIEYEDGTYYNYFIQKGLRAYDGVECLLAKGSFQSLWCSINGIESWEANPWVWVISFKVLSTAGKPEELRKEAAHA